MKCAIFSDLHIHPHQNDYAFVDRAIGVLEWIRTTCIERKINKVFFLGDWFHKRKTIDPVILGKSYKKLLEFKNSGVDVIMIPGNHDMPLGNSTAYNSLTVFGGVGYVINEPFEYKDGDYSFWLLPYIHDQDELADIIKEIVSQVRSDTKAYLLAHLDVVGAKYAGGAISKHGITPNNVPSCFEKVISGHYHINQTIKDRIIYVGTPYQQSFGEAMHTPGFYIFDDGELEFIENTFSARFVDIETREELTEENIRNNYVRLFVEEEDSQEIIDEVLSIKPQKLRVVTRAKEIAVDKAIFSDMHMKNIDTVLYEWVSKTVDGDIEKYYEYGKSIVNEVK